MPSISVQCEADPRVAIMPGVTRIYVGERSCVERFMYLVSCGVLRESLKAIRAAGIEAGLTTPILVPEGNRETVAAAIESMLPDVDVLHTGDLGVAAHFGNRVPITFQGAITNPSAASFLAGIGVRHVRLTMPYSRLVRELEASRMVEVQVFGSIPANFTPICLWRTTHRDGRACDPQCVDESLVFRRGPDSLVLRAKGLMTGRVLDLTGRLAEFDGTATYLIDSFGLTAGEVNEAVSAVREGRQCRTTRSRFNGVGQFVGGDVFRSMPWRRLVDRTAGD